MKLSSRGKVPAFIAMEVFKAASELEVTGHVVHHMEVGQPATRAPSLVLQEARELLDKNLIGYTNSLGISDLRKAIASHYADAYGLDLDPGRVIVTTGSSGAFLLSFLLAFESGDKVALADPGYPAYRNILTALGLNPVGLPTSAQTNFQPTIELLEKLEQPVQGLLVASPSNPAGTMLGRDELSALIDYCHEKDICFISDEIYHGITYGKKAETALTFSDEVIVINSFSKYFSMTGWRLGWMILPTHMVSAVESLAQNLFISPPALSQLAAVRAFECKKELDQHVANYALNREILLKRLPQMGIDKLASADGAFYIYADVGHLTNDSVAFCKKMLTETGVAATPGLDFDRDRGSRFVRLSFAGSKETIELACDALADWLGK